jgi:RNA polymerase sigma-70 factor (ECF subfamily)
VTPIAPQPLPRALWFHGFVCHSPGTASRLAPKLGRARPSGQAFDQVVQAAARGEHAALTRLFRAYQPMLLRYLRSQGPDVADDVASEVWIAVARQLARFVGDEPGFRRWLFTIARRRLIEARRKQARQRSSAAPPDELEQISRAPERFVDDPATVVVDDVSSQEAVERVSAGLTREQAEVVLLRIVAGFTVAEVAAVTGRTPASVRVLCHRALRRLRALFPEEVLVE